MEKWGGGVDQRVRVRYGNRTSMLIILKVVTLSRVVIDGLLVFPRRFFSVLI